MKVFGKYYTSLILVLSMGFFASCSKEAVEELVEEQEISLVGEWQFEANSENLLFIEFTKDNRAVLNYQPTAITFDINGSSSSIFNFSTAKTNTEVKYLSMVSNFEFENNTLTIEKFNQFDLSSVNEDQIVLQNGTKSYVLNRVASKYSSYSELFNSTIWKVVSQNGEEVSENRHMGWTLNGHYYYFLGDDLVTGNETLQFLGGDFNMSTNSKSDINFTFDGMELFVKLDYSGVTVRDNQGNTIILEEYKGNF